MAGLTTGADLSQAFLDGICEPQPETGYLRNLADAGATLFGLDSACLRDLVRDDDRHPFLRAACCMNAHPDLYRALVTAMLRRGVPAGMADAHGETALFNLPAREGWRESLPLLVAHGADVNSRDNAGDTPLINAAMNGHTAALEWLLNHGAHIDGKNNRGQTALICAIISAEPEAAGLLVRRGAFLRGRDARGDTLDEIISWSLPPDHAAHFKTLIKEASRERATALRDMMLTAALTLPKQPALKKPRRSP